MKEINLISLVQAFRGLEAPLYKSYCNYFNVSPKETEILGIESYIEELKKVSPDIRMFDNYYLGYKIPQIGKEFDLLRFSNEYIVNIELKSINTGERILKQLIRNRYYLSFLNKPLHIFTYVSSEKQLYTIDEYDRLVPVNLSELSCILLNQNKVEIPNIDNLFNPSNYLVSPFNSTDEFIQGKYFLTGQQEEIKNKCINEINRKGTSFLSICGKAGTGKTLLTFDIAKEYISNHYKVLIMHCGKLNAGHIKLRDEYGWEIIPIKDWSSKTLQDYYFIIIDETQRIYPSQLGTIISKIKENNGNCVFSYDGQQCLRNGESNNNIPQIISDKTSSTVFELTEKIRTNKEIASFIIALFDKSKKIEKINRDNIELKYFQTYEDAKEHILLLGSQDWKVINYTPSRKHTHPYEKFAISMKDNAHEVIGQEFDKVIAVIDQFFYYEDKSLSIRDYSQIPYYNPPKMLFQIMTRTRRKLCIIIINNNEIMSRCLSILDFSPE